MPKDWQGAPTQVFATDQDFVMVGALDVPALDAEVAKLQLSGPLPAPTTRATSGTAWVAALI